jgi:hypothetical protein
MITAQMVSDAQGEWCGRPHIHGVKSGVWAEFIAEKLNQAIAVAIPPAPKKPNFRKMAQVFLSEQEGVEIDERCSACDTLTAVFALIDGEAIQREQHTLIERVRKLRATIQSWQDNNASSWMKDERDRAFVHGAKSAQRTILIEIDKLFREEWKG